MKKFLLSLFALLGVVGVNAQTTADVSGFENAVYAEGGHYAVGQEFQLPIKIKNGIDAQACTFYVTLQEGLSFVPNEKDATAIAATLADASADHTIMSNISSGMVALFSATNTILSENLVYLHLTAAAAGEYTVTIHSLNASNADTKVEINEANSFVSTVVIDDYLTLDENSTVAPMDYSGSVLVKRTIKANEWGTICLPFDMYAADVEKVFGADAQFALFTGYTKDGGLASTSASKTAESIVLNFETQDWTEDGDDGIFANTPYLVKLSKDITDFTLEAVDLSVAEAPKTEVKRNGTTGRVVGTFYGTTVAGNYVPENSLFLSGGKFYYSKGKTKIKGLRGYFTLNDVLADMASSNGVKMDFDVVTKIDGVRLTDSEGAVYTVDGKFIGRNVDLKKLQKGIYVVDGKKVAVK